MSEEGIFLFCNTEIRINDDIHTSLECHFVLGSALLKFQDKTNSVPPYYFKDLVYKVL